MPIHFQGDPMPRHILVFYGSYRQGRQGIKLARWLVDAIDARGDRAELIDAKTVGLPMLDRMYKEYPKGEAPPAMEELAGKLRTADGRSEEHTSELQSLMRISYAVFCLQKKTTCQHNEHDAATRHPHRW